MRTYQVESNTIEGERLRPRVAAFLEANGIDPYQVPRDATVHVVGGEIVCEVYDRDEAGNRYAVDGEIAMTTVRAPLRVSMREATRGAGA